VRRRPNYPRPTHIRTGLDALHFATWFEFTHGMWIDAAHVAQGGHEVLDVEHESAIMVDYGPDALIRYYAPNDPRLPALGDGREVTE